MTSHSRLPYIPALDGIRGLSVFAVLLHHLELPWFRLGFLGVDLFFVLSGFLITTLLVQEWQESGSINLPQFFRRRLLRLLPALITVLTVTVLLMSQLGHVLEQEATWTGVWSSLLYVSNWAIIFSTHSITALNTLQVTWSLSIEDQFYIVWALSLPLALRYLPRRIFISSLCLLAFVSALLGAMYWLQDLGWNRSYMGSDARAVTLLIGCIAGLLYAWGKLPHSRLYTLGLRATPGIGLGYVVWLQSFPFEEQQARFLTGGAIIVSLASVALILLVATHPNPPRLVAALSWKPLVWVGAISYGVYLWHPLVIWLLAPPRVNLDSLVSNVLIIALSLLTAAVCHRYIERPFLRLKYGKPKSAVPVVTPQTSLEPASSFLTQAANGT